MNLTAKLRRDYFVRLTIMGVLLGGMALVFVLLGLRHRPVFILVGLVPLTLWLAITIWNYRRGLATLDPKGVIRRDGQRFEWADLQKIDRVHARIHGQIGPLNHLKLSFRGGIVTMFPFTIENCGAILQAIESAERGAPKRDG